MNISINWLRQYIDTSLTTKEIDDKLTLLGLEVEGHEEIGSDFDGFVIGNVEDVRPHPNADRLQLCDVNLGDETVQIVCGAENVAKNQKVAVAKVGSTLPAPLPNGDMLTIKKAKLRGEKSHGMICSEVELGIGDDHSGIMVLDTEKDAGTPLKDVLEVEKDDVLEIGLTPNRPDAACHIGVARDLAAVVDNSLKNPYAEIPEPKAEGTDEIDITIEDSDKCHRYVGLIVEGITVEPSPNWLQNRLTSIGLRPVNNVVDITNFVLHEIGQPLHAFDYDKIGGKKISVKTFDKKTKFKTLDDQERNVPADTLFICDGNGPVAIAGVMGGESSEVSNETNKILIESAYFDPSSIRKASKALALQTDSSYRFERGIDPTIQYKAVKRAADLIAEIAGGTVQETYTDVHPVKPEQTSLTLRPSRVHKVLGTDLDREKMTEILSALEFEITDESEDLITCTVPFFRPDVSREVDLIEEVGRVFDYNNIPTPDSSPFFTPKSLTDWERFNENLRSAAKALAYKEISTNSLLSKKESDLMADEKLQIQTMNPVSQENTTLRTHLTAGFLKAVQYNFNRKENQLRFFEIGHTFKKDNNGTWIDGVKEHTHLLFGLSGFKTFESWSGDPQPFSIYDLKSDVEAFFRDFGVEGAVEQNAVNNYQLEYSIGETLVGTLRIVDDSLKKGFDIKEDAFVAEIDVTELYNLGYASKDVEYQKVSKYPSFEFDAAFIVDQVTRAGDLAREIHSTADETLKTVDVFDVYEGENLGSGKKSIAFRLSFLDSNKTLTINDVEPKVQKVVQSLKKKFDAKLRS